jgi:DNA-binding PadR family transcriptional regulator
MEQIAYDILAYLAENPEAQDTLEGIVEWWLSGQATRSNKGLVEGVLTELVNRGLVLARRGKGVRTYYKVNRRKMKEISALLARVSTPGEQKD